MGSQLQKPLIGTQVNWGNPLSKGLVGCWLMNEGAGDRIYDLSLNGHDGVFALGSAWASGRSGSAIKFDGGNSRVGVGSLAFRADQASISILFKSINIGVAQRLFVRGTGSSGNDFSLQLATSQLNGIIGENGGGLFIGTKTSTLKSDIWYHAVLVFGGMVDSLKIYLHGIENVDDSNATTSLSTSALTSRIGTKLNSTATFDGLIDNVILWNRALSPQEVSELYLNPYGMFEHVPVWMMAQILAGRLRTPWLAKYIRTRR